jgi:hypothetical protein
MLIDIAVRNGNMLTRAKSHSITRNVLHKAAVATTSLLLLGGAFAAPAQADISPENGPVVRANWPNCAGLTHGAATLLISNACWYALHFEMEVSPPAGPLFTARGRIPMRESLTVNFGVGGRITRLVGFLEL